jgi:hypothetical protein
MTLKKLALGAGLTLALSILSACGGGGGGGTSGGGGGGNGGGDSGDVLRYPYETVFGDACRSSSEPTPGCTFVRSTGLRVTVSADPMYNSQGYGSDDMWYVKFDVYGNAKVYDDLGNVQKDAYGNDKVYHASDFAGYQGGNTIGVGQTGAFWENVTGKDYWFGKNGVLYSANTNASNYGQAINNKGAGSANNTNSKSMKSSTNVALIKAGAVKLQSLGIKDAGKATAIASALNSMAVMSVERGAITQADYNRAFSTAFGGVKYEEAIAAYKDFAVGNKATARSLATRSANNLGLSPQDGEKYMKALYRSQLSKFGYNVDDISLEDGK